MDQQPTITRSIVSSLRDEAGSAGDESLRDDCDLWLNGTADDAVTARIQAALDLGTEVQS